MPTTALRVILRKEDLDPQRISEDVVVVVDTLFATTSIVTALAEGADTVLPARDETEARRLAAACGDDGRVVLSGEYLAATLPGFIAATPLALRKHGLAGKTLVYSTTNGTVALRQAAAADKVYVACLRNARATVDHLVAACGARTVQIVCSGSAGHFNLEDFYTAGWLVRHLLARRTFSLNDAALAASGYPLGDHVKALWDSRVGRLFADDYPEDIEFAGQADCVDLVARLIDGRVVTVDGPG